MLGFAPALKYLWSQILCKLYKSPSDETINWGPPCVYACQKVTYARYRSCSPCQSLVDYGNIKVSHHALKVSECSSCWSSALHERRRNHLPNTSSDMVYQLAVLYVTKPVLTFVGLCRWQQWSYAGIHVWTFWEESVTEIRRISALEEAESTVKPRTGYRHICLGLITITPDVIPWNRIR